LCAGGAKHSIRHNAQWGHASPPSSSERKKTKGTAGGVGEQNKNCPRKLWESKKRRNVPSKEPRNALIVELTALVREKRGRWTRHFRAMETKRGTRPSKGSSLTSKAAEREVAVFKKKKEEGN